MPTTIPNPPPTPVRTEGAAAFNAKAGPFVDWLVTFTTAMNTMIVEIAAYAASALGYANAAGSSASDAQGYALAASNSASTALTQAGIATSAATTAVNAPGTSATSTDSRLIALGPMSFTIQTGKSILPFMYLIIAKDGSNYMVAQVTSYNSGTGALAVNVVAMIGSGTYATWSMVLSAPLVKTTVQSVADTTALAAILVPGNGDSALVQNFGYYSFNSGFTGVVDGSLALAATDGTTGAWVLECVSPDTMLQLLEDNFNSIITRIEALEPISTGEPLVLTALLPMTASSLGTDSYLEFSVPVPGAEVGDTVAMALTYYMGSSFPAGQGRVGWRPEIRAKGIVTIVIFNQSASTASPTPGLWAIRVFKK